MGKTATNLVNNSLESPPCAVSAPDFRVGYEPPRHGILAVFPARWRPYAELARLDKPGFALLWIVHYCGVLQASILNGARPLDLLKLGAFFFIACQFLMWLNFAWNDTCDVRFDGQVWRTRHRPLVRGALSLRQALILDGLLTGVLILLLLPLTPACIAYAFPLGFGCFVYPLAKRVTNYPQLVLGIVLPGGVYMGAAAAGSPGLPYPGALKDLFQVTAWVWPPYATMSALGASYCTIAVWIVFTETVYSFQDAKWDEVAGVGTITRVIGDSISAKVFLFILAGVQVTLFIYTGMSLEFHSAVWVLSTYATALTLALTIVCVDLHDADSCLFWFQAGNLITGAAMMMGYAGEYMSRPDNISLLN